MKALLRAILGVLLVGGMAVAVEVPSAKLITNVRVWDGQSSEAKSGLDVLVVGNLIRRVEPNIPKSGTYEINYTQFCTCNLSVSLG